MIPQYLFLFSDQNNYHDSFKIDNITASISQIADINHTGIILVKVGEHLTAGIVTKNVYNIRYCDWTADALPCKHSLL